MATTCGAIRLRSARPRSHQSWPRPNPASGSTNTWKAIARRLRPRLQAWPRRCRLEAEGLDLSLWPLARLAQNEELGCTGREARSGGGLGKGAPAMSAAPERGRNRIMIYGPKSDGTYIVEFRMADGESLAISVPAEETRVLKHFQARMPYGLFVPDVL